MGVDPAGQRPAGSSGARPVCPSLGRLSPAPITDIPREGDPTGPPALRDGSDIDGLSSTSFPSRTWTTVRTEFIEDETRPSTGSRRRGSSVRGQPTHRRDCAPDANQRTHGTERRAPGHRVVLTTPSGHAPPCRKEVPMRTFAKPRVVGAVL